MLGCTHKLSMQGPPLNLGFPVLLLLIVLIAGCNNSCFVGFWNPPNGTIGIVAGNPPPTCTSPKGMGTVQVVANVARMCESCSESNRIQGLFVSLRGIELHPIVNASEESSDWRELLPQIENHVRQIDLMKANGIDAEPLVSGTTIPAGSYDLVRLRFVPNQGDTDNLLGSGSACGRVASNCAIMGDGRILPLALNGDGPEILVSPDIFSGKSLFVPRDSDSELLIDLMPVWVTVTAPIGESSRFLPALMGSAKIGPQLAAKDVIAPKENPIP